MNEINTREYAAIVLTADRHVEVCLHTCMYSLLERTSIYLKIYLVSDGFSNQQINSLEATLEEFKYKFELIHIYMSDKKFGNLRSLKGSYYVYTKITAFESINESRLIYLDVDTLVLLDIRELYEVDLKEHALGAGGLRRVDMSPDKDFYLSHGYQENEWVFNAGVLLIDVEKWREYALTNNFFHLAAISKKSTRTASQAILNTIIKDQFEPLDQKYNILLHPWYPKLTNQRLSAIYHFAGHPKPWDFGGEKLHKNAWLYRRTLEKTVLKNKFPSYKFTSKNIYKQLYSIKSYYKCLRVSS